MDIRERLNALADPGYRKFHSGLLPGVEDILGVRSPDLKKLAKEILAGDWRGYLAEASDGSHEERLLQGLVIAGAWRGMDREELFRRTEEFVAKIDSWAICDAFCGAYKAADGGLRDAVWEFVRPYFEREGEYELRFAAVMALSHYCDEAHAGEVFAYFDRIRSQAYYVRMAVAWAVSIYYIKMPERTMEYLRDCALDDWTYNKALQKITESTRVSWETKEQIRGMKRK